MSDVHGEEVTRGACGPVPGRPNERAVLYGAAHDAYHKAREQGEVVVGDLARLMTDAVLAHLEYVGWLQDADTNDPAPVKMKDGKAFYAGDVGVCVPIFRLPSPHCACGGVLTSCPTCGDEWCAACEGNECEP